MATDPNAIRAAQAGKTVITTDGYEVTYDENGFGRKSVAPDGSTKYYDSLGNQTSTAWTGPTPKAEQTPAASEAPAPAAQDTTPKAEQTPAASEAPAPAAQDTTNTVATPAPTTVETNNSVLATITGKPDIKTTVDNGSDPYVSNGQSTVPQAEPKPESQPEPDPFEAARQKAEDTPPGPTEQAVLDASKEPLLTKEKAAALEKEQADNRAKLKAEELPQKPTGNVVQLDPSKDWRVRMSIAPTLMALYHLASPNDILYPLKQTNGVIFPYTPTIQTGYKANYEVSDLVHTNYKNYFYKNSNIEDLTITADFTAQDQQEAQYMLAVMHFFRSVTKMFYGQDKSPNAGTPPPLVFLSGFGAYQYDNHPVLISSFSYTLPNDVDYIRTTSSGGYASATASAVSGASGLSGLASTASKFGLGGVSKMFSSISRLASSGLNKGGGATPSVGTIKGITSRSDTTYVPTKIQFSISAYPIITRRDMSQNFSLEKYAKGTIYRGSQRGGSGIW